MFLFPFPAFGSLIHIEKFQTETSLGSDVDFGPWFAHQISYAWCSPRIELIQSPIYYKWLTSSLHPWFKLSLYEDYIIPPQFLSLGNGEWHSFGAIYDYTAAPAACLHTTTLRDFHIHWFSHTMMSSHTNSWELIKQHFINSFQNQTQFKFLQISWKTLQQTSCLCL